MDAVSDLNSLSSYSIGMQLNDNSRFILTHFARLAYNLRTKPYNVYTTKSLSPRGGGGGLNLSRGKRGQ